MASFREQLSRITESRDTADGGNESLLSSWKSSIQSINPFSNGRVSLPTTEPVGSSANVVENVPTADEPEWFTLSRWDRLLVFGICIAGSLACFFIGFLLFPVLALKPRKFVLIWTLGGLLFVISFGVLQGPVNYIQHLISPQRLPFSLFFFGSSIMTLIASLVMRSTILTILFGVLEVISVIYYTVSYFPMGTQSLRFASRVGTRQVTSWINS